jgi:hypothetical protein
MSKKTVSFLGSTFEVFSRKNKGSPYLAHYFVLIDLFMQESQIANPPEIIELFFGGIDQDTPRGIILSPSTVSLYYQIHSI